eukprot:2770053-Pyramimonas_sp.AAC.1
MKCKSLSLFPLLRLGIGQRSSSPSSPSSSSSFFCLGGRSAAPSRPVPANSERVQQQQQRHRRASSGAVPGSAGLARRGVDRTAQCGSRGGACNRKGR